MRDFTKLTAELRQAIRTAVGNWMRLMNGVPGGERDRDRYRTFLASRAYGIVEELCTEGGGPFVMTDDEFRLAERLATYLAWRRCGWSPAAAEIETIA